MFADLLTPKTLKTLEAFKLQSRRKFLGFRQGGHISLRRGHGIEFSDYRNYELGDDPRHIDWGVYARSDKLYVKRFQEEQDLNVYLLLDNSPSLFFPEQEKKWQRLISLALAIAYVALMQGDTVYFVVLGEQQPLACRSVSELNRIAELLKKSKAHQVSDWSERMQKAAYSLRFPGVAYLLSDLMFESEEVSSLIMSLLSRNLETNVIRIGATSDLDPFLGRTSFFEARDSESGALHQINFDAAAQKSYFELIKQHQQQILRFMHSKGVAYAVFQATQSLVDFITTDLKPLGVMQC